MPQYFIELYSDPFFLNEYVFHFPGNDDAYIVIRDGEYYLTGPLFQNSESFDKFVLVANKVMDEMHAVLSVSSPWMERPRIGNPFRIEDDGTIVGGENPGTGGGMILLPVRQLPEDLSSIPTPTKAQLLRSKVREDRHLDFALTLVALPSARWSHLYRCLEELEAHLGAKVSTRGFCSESERERFTRTANTAEAAGLDSRHRVGKFAPPTRPMSLDEAKKFVRKLCASTANQSTASHQQSGPSSNGAA